METKPKEQNSMSVDILIQQKDLKKKKYEESPSLNYNAEVIKIIELIKRNAINFKGKKVILFI